MIFTFRLACPNGYGDGAHVDVSAPDEAEARALAQERLRRIVGATHPDRREAALSRATLYLVERHATPAERDAADRDRRIAEDHGDARVHARREGGR